MQIATIGLDLAKHVFQLHGVGADGCVILRRKLRRTHMMPFFASLPPCLIGMEACASAHYWARELSAFGHEVRLMPAHYVKAYVKRGKNDAADAEAICLMRTQFQNLDERCSAARRAARRARETGHRDRR